MRRTHKNTRANFRKTRRVKGGGQGQSLSTRDRLREKIQKEQADIMNPNSILAKQAETDRAKEAIRERDRKRAEKIRNEIAEKKAVEEVNNAAEKAARTAEKAARTAKKAARTAKKVAPSAFTSPLSPTLVKPPDPPVKPPAPPVQPPAPPLPPPTPPVNKVALKRENKIKKWTSTLNLPPSKFWEEFFEKDELQRLRVELNKPELCECVKPIFYVPPVANDPVNIALCKLFVIYGIISAKFERYKYIYNILWKGTRALYLNVANKSLETRDLDITIVNRHGYVNEKDVTNIQHLANHIGELSKSLLDDTHIELLEPSNPIARNKDIIKLSYKIESGEYIPISDIGFKRTEYKGNIEYLEKTETNCVAENDVLYLYQTTPYMKAEKEYYLDEYQRRLVTSSNDELENQLNYDINRMKIGLNKISQLETDTDIYKIEKENETDTEYAKEIYNTAMADKAERLKLQATVKEGKLTKEELQELINSLSKRV